MEESKNNRSLKIKVCGMRSEANVRALNQLPVDFIGFIFYSKSKRSVININLPETENLNRVGVFVNEETEYILTQARQWKLNYIQLHGDESAAQCMDIKSHNLKVMKAISIGAAYDFSLLEPYYSAVDYFVFDTKGAERGGNGISFDWSILNNYTGKVPFFLSGGISIDSVTAIQEFHHPQLYALDINSCFEDEPGLKNIERIKTFIYELQH